MLCISSAILTRLRIGKKENAIYPSLPLYCASDCNTVLSDNTLTFTARKINKTHDKNRIGKNWFRFFKMHAVFKSSYLIAQMCVYDIFYCSPQLIASVDIIDLHRELCNILTSVLLAFDCNDTSVKKLYNEIYIFITGMK